MHKCPRCGYEPLPTPTSEPVVDNTYGKWRVMVWTEECHEHRWVSEYDTEEDANIIASLLSERLRMRGIEKEDDTD